MNTTLWITAAIASTVYVVGGASLLLLSRNSYRSLGPSQYWIDDFGDGHLKAIGTIKLIGAVGLILPAATGFATVLTPLAACGLALFMAGAATTRFRRSEWLSMAGDVVFLGVFAFLAWGRFTLPVS
ncbi:DoxX family protein [Mycobacterium sp. 236(2023)]|uniref:DoxX family protein n=1 Tax=Mycobacterium sp. 236(2023) TaxID=3038163 RepID=UPI00241527B8|nr:DoxX family protein [Mycobacterium sp. 236(2023)]MDG4667269.1 DoxX family protein [Mycobacterium sp. 236(2023)]